MDATLIGINQPVGVDTAFVWGVCRTVRVDTTRIWGVCWSIWLAATILASVCRSIRLATTIFSSISGSVRLANARRVVRWQLLWRRLHYGTVRMESSIWWWWLRSIRLGSTIRRCQSRAIRLDTANRFHNQC
jgi:hypothetical protein